MTQEVIREIMNPGGLYGQARPENFPHINDYRNSVAVRMMKQLQSLKTEGIKCKSSNIRNKTTKNKDRQ